MTVNIAQATDERVIVEALSEVLNNDIYSRNAKLIFRKLAKTPFDSAAKFVKWVEFAADYPDLNELNLPYHGLNFLTYYSLDVVLLSLALSIGALTLALLLSRLTVRALITVLQRWAVTGAGSEKLKAS